MTTPAANSSSGSNSHLMLGLVIAAAVLLAVTLAASGWLTYRYCCVKVGSNRVLSAAKVECPLPSSLKRHTEVTPIVPWV